MPQYGRMGGKHDHMWAQVEMQEEDAARPRNFIVRIKYAAAVNPAELIQFAE